MVEAGSRTHDAHVHMTYIVYQSEAFFPGGT